MRSLICRKVEMASRVRDFTKARLAVEPGYGPALMRLEENLARAQSIEARLQESLRDVSAARARRIALRQEIQAGFSIADPHLEQAAEALRIARESFEKARDSLEAVCIDIMELVKLIGGITSYRFGYEHEIMADWMVARLIPRAPRRNDPPVGVGFRPAA